MSVNHALCIDVANIQKKLVKSQLLLVFSSYSLSSFGNKCTDNRFSMHNVFTYKKCKIDDYNILFLIFFSIFVSTIPRNQH